MGVTACGGDDSASGASKSGDAAAPIQLVTIGPISAKGFSLPSVPLGAQVAIDEVNAAGGVNGHKLQLTSCNDDNDPNTAAKCARQAVKDKVSAMVGGFSLQEAQVIPTLERGGIPSIGFGAVAGYTNKNLYLVGGEAPTSYIGVGAVLAEKGCNVIGVVRDDTPGSAPATDLIKLGALSKGKKWGGAVKASQNAADWGPAVATALSKGMDCAGIVTTPASAAKVVVAGAKAGGKLRFGANSGGLPETLLKALGKAADGTVLVGGYLPLANATDPTVKSLAEKVSAKDPKVPLDQFVTSGYASVKVFAEALKDSTKFDPATVAAALSKVKGFDTGVGPVVDFTTANQVPAFSRITNPKVFPVEYTGGKSVVDKGGPLDMTPAFAMAAKAAGK
jgi:ABC-type branched-subunit amino acid transport system substrate-binding protein